MIQSGDIKLLKSQVLLDTADGGGAMTGNEVVDGQSNNLFPDISELDRTYGRISLRKAFAAILTGTVDSYYGSHAIISRKPADPRVSVSLFSTRNWFDRRTAARDNIEGYLARGPRWAGHLLETQLAGQRAIQMCIRPNDPVPAIGQGLCLVQDESLGTELEQYVRVTKTSVVDRIFVVKERDVTRTVVTIEISDPLRFTFEGPTVQDFEISGTLPRAICRDTRVANAATYYGIAQLVLDAAIGSVDVRVDNVFTQLVPSAQSETPIIDQPAAAHSNLYVPAANAAISTIFNGTIAPGVVLHLGSPCYPGTLSLVCGGYTITDSAGVLKNSSTDIGTLDPATGLLTFNSAAPSYTGSMTATFMPAGVPARVQETASITITQEIRGYNYAITLQPIPQAGSLVVSYVSQGKVYYLYEHGDGALKGIDTAFGSGVLSFNTGTVLITTGALPDANSEIIFAWGKRTDTFIRSNINVPPACLEFQLAHEQIAPGLLSVSWRVNDQLHTATDDGNGGLIGDATGVVQYARGVVKLTPAVLPQQGAEFEFVYQYGPPHEQRFDMPARGPSGDVSIVLPDMGGAVMPKSVDITWNVDIIDSETLGQIFSETSQTWTNIPRGFRVDPLVHAKDNGSGAQG